MTPYELLEAIGNCPIDGTLLPDLQRQAREMVYAREEESQPATKHESWCGYHVTGACCDCGVSRETG